MSHPIATHPNLYDRPQIPVRSREVATDVAIRRALREDAVVVERLVALDGGAAPEGSVLIAEVGGEPWAAVGIDDGRAVADPFRPAAPVVELLHARAAHLRTGARGARLIPRLRALLPA